MSVGLTAHLSCSAWIPRPSALGSVFLAFWSVMLVLHVPALLTGSRAYVAAITILLAPAAWKWAVHAVGLMGI